MRLYEAKWGYEAIYMRLFKNGNIYKIQQESTLLLKINPSENNNCLD